jgi:hypothetical protein
MRLGWFAVVATCALAGCGSSEANRPTSGSVCPPCEIANLDGRCVPNRRGCGATGPYLGYYGVDPGVFAPVAPTRGIYLDGGEFEVPGASERTQCTYVIPSPDQDFTLARYEARMRAGSHHFNMMRYEPGVLEASGFELGVPRDCTPLGVPIYVAGSEWQYVDAPLPRGLGSKIPAGSGLVMEVHYLNTSPEAIRGKVEVNLYERDPAEVEHLAGVYFNIMSQFEVPPRSTAKFSARCPAREGTNVVMLTSHMHRFGRRFTIDLFDDAAGTKKPLYESTDYGHPLVVQHASDPIVIGPNQGFEWSCEFENFLDERVVDGEMGLTDEMCIMIAYYYDYEGELPYCGRAAVKVE